jgi:hypothetical protein
VKKSVIAILFHHCLIFFHDLLHKKAIEAELELKFKIDTLLVFNYTFTHYFFAYTLLIIYFIILLKETETEPTENLI